MMMNAQQTRHVWITAVLIHASLIPVERMHYAKQPITDQFADALRTGQAIHIRNAFNVGLMGHLGIVKATKVYPLFQL